STRLRAEAPKMLWADSVSTAYLIYLIPYVPIGLRIPEEEWRDTKSHQVIRSRDITFLDSIYRARSVTDSSSLLKPIQKSQVVLVNISENLAKNDNIVAEHGLSSEITQSPGGSSDTSMGSENSGSFDDSGRSDEEDSEDGASSEEGGSETPQKAINEEMVSLEKNQTCSLVRLLTRKKASQSLWMFKVKEEQNSSKGYEAPLSIIVAEAFLYSWNKEPCRDVHQVGYEREVKVLCSFNWPLRELKTEDGVLPERGYSQFNDVSS
ncbi:hypothetical protein Tco_1340180, partial [Tanacetum coccineum]